MKTSYVVEYTIEYYSSMFDMDIEYESKEFKTKKEALKFLNTLLLNGKPIYPYFDIEFYKKIKLDYETTN